MTATDTLLDPAGPDAPQPADGPPDEPGTGRPGRTGRPGLSGGPGRSAVRRGLRAVPRLAAVAGVGGLAAAAVVGAGVWEPPSSPAPAPRPLPLTAAAVVPVCPGAQTLQVPEGGTPVAAGTTSVGAVVAPAGLLPGGGTTAAEPTATTLARMTGAEPAPGVEGTGSATRAAVVRSRVGGSEQAGPLRLDTARTVSGALPAVSAVQVGLARTGDLRGLTATPCRPATTSAWLVGGGTQVGRRARLLLANPAPSPAVVDLDVRGPRGRVDTPTGEGLVVPAGGSRVVYLDALAPALDALAVRVVARSGRVAASLHDEVMRGLTPGGTDGVSASAPASRRQVVPGMAVRTPAGDDAPRTATDPGAAAVRIAVPGTSDAVVQVRLLGPDGPVAPDDAVLTVPAGAVADLPLTGVPDGTYTAVVEADVPVVAAGLVGRVGAPPSAPEDQTGGDVPAVLPGATPVADLAWAASAGRVTGLVAVAALPGASVDAQVVLGSPDGAAVMLVPLADDGTPGTPQQVDVAAGTTRTVPLEAGSAGALVRTRSGAVHVAVTYGAQDEQGDLVAVTTVRPGASTPGEPPTVREDPSAGLG